MQTNYELNRVDFKYFKDRLTNLSNQVQQRVDFAASPRQKQMTLTEVKLNVAFVVDQIKDDVPLNEHIEVLIDAIEIRNRIQTIASLKAMIAELKALITDLQILEWWYFDEVVVIKGVVDTNFATEIKEQMTEAQLGQLIDEHVLDAPKDLALQDVVSVHTRLTPELFTEGQVELFVYVRAEVMN